MDLKKVEQMAQVAWLQAKPSRKLNSILVTHSTSQFFKRAAISICFCLPAIARAQVTETPRYYACNGFLINFYDFHFPAETPDSFIASGNEIVSDEAKVEKQVCSGIVALQPMTSDESADITERISALNTEKDTSVFNAAMNDDLPGYLTALQDWEDNFYDLYRETVRLENKRGLGPAQQFLMNSANSFYTIVGLSGANLEMPARQVDEIAVQIGQNTEEKLLEQNPPSAAPAWFYFLQQLHAAPK